LSFRTTNFTKKIMKENQYLKLLPNFSKKIGISCIVAMVALCIASVIFNWFESDKMMILGEVTKVITLLSLLVIILSKDKVEDELVALLRLKALVFAFFSGVLYSITLPISNYLFTGVYTQFIDANTILIFMLIIYFLMFFYLKRKR
jgi:hypothetical protein